MPVGRVWTYRDITESRRSERSLREQAEWFSVTLGSIGDAVITVNADCRVNYLNPMAERYTGWSSADAAGKPIAEVMRIVNEGTREHAAPNPIDAALTEGRIVGLGNHTVLVGRDGDGAPIEDSAAPIKDPSGRIIGAVMVFHDVSGRRDNERAMARLYDGEQQARGAAEQANKAKDEFLAALSHELRTPLTPVLGVLSSLPTDGSIPEALAADLEIVRRNIEVEARLIDDLLDVTRISQRQAGAPFRARPASAAMVDEADRHLPARHRRKAPLARARPRAGPGRDRRRPPAHHPGPLEPPQESIKFTPEGGRIMIRSHTESHVEGEMVVIEVEDTGMGIERRRRWTGSSRPLARAAAISRSSSAGSGSGWRSAAGSRPPIAGTITAFSRGRGQGSTFTLTLPCGNLQAASPAAVRRNISSGKADSGSRLRILLVEDHADTAVILTRLLSRMGHEVLHAATVADGVALAEREIAGAGTRSRGQRRRPAGRQRHWT